MPQAASTGAAGASGIRSHRQDRPLAANIGMRGPSTSLPHRDVPW